MSKNNYLDHVNKKQDKSTEKESFKKESFEKTNTKRAIPIIPLVLLAIIVIVVFFMLNQKTEILDLENLTLEEAMTWASESEINISSSNIFSNIEEGRVIEQSIQAGDKVKSKTILKLKVSAGLDPYEKVDLASFDTSWSRSAVLQWLTENEIENYSFIEESNDIIEEDFLIRFKLIGATEESFNRSSEIEFILSQVIDTGSVEIPDFMNASLTNVDIWASSENIVYEINYLTNDIYDNEKIFYQSILAGQNMSREEVLVIHVSLGSEFEPVEMINFINMSLNNAEAWLKNNHVAFKKTYYYSDLYNENTVMDQSIYEGSIISDETITLKISLGQGRQVEDFSNISYEEALYIASQNNNIDVTQAYSDLTKDSLIYQSLVSDTYMTSEDYLSLSYSKGSYINIPDFSNQSLYDFELWLMNQNDQGANLSTNIKEVESLNKVSGVIIRQDNYSGKISMGSVILMDVSKGMTIPDFSTMTYEQALTFGQESFVSLYVKEIYKLNTTSGDFISQSLSFGEGADGQSDLEVVYALGQDIIVPSFVNQSLSDIELWVNSLNASGAGLQINVHEEFDLDIEYGMIMSQSIMRKSTPVGSGIDLIVSRGESVTVPDFSTYTVDSIEAMCNSLGITLIIEEVPASTLVSGSFISQLPQASEFMSKNEFIYIKLAE